MRKKPISEIYKKRASEPDFASFDVLPYYVPDLFLELEDAYFFYHGALDYEAICSSIRNNIREKSIKYGASTITQQLCKNLYFTFESSFKRKICEMFIAFKAERILNKKEILELYLNVICFDNGQYGISQASDFYFGKKACELTFNEAFILGVMLPVVGVYNICLVPEKFCKYKNRRAVLHTFDMEREEILRHDAENLDEDLLPHSSDEYKFFAVGPMRNEKYGVDSSWQEDINNKKHSIGREWKENSKIEKKQGQPPAELILVNYCHKIPDDYVYQLAETENGEKINRCCSKELEQLLNECRIAGGEPIVVSAYRTKEEQKALFDEAVKYNMSESIMSLRRVQIFTSRYIAVPGTSEHEIGLAVDFSVKDNGSDSTCSFTDKWLEENAWRYGFIQRYPKKSEFYTHVAYEKWHYRYVGKQYAEEIHMLGITLEEYLERYYCM